MAQQKSITFFFRKKREISEVDENDEVKEVNSIEISFLLLLTVQDGCDNSEASENNVQYTSSITNTNLATKFEC